MSDSNACERCKVVPPIHKGRYCKDCKKLVLAELRASGYLTTYPGHGYRPPDKREAIHDTKYGIDR